VPTFEIEFEVDCGECGKELTHKSVTNADRYEGYKVTVEPCPDCLAGARDEGRGEGNDEGYEERKSEEEEVHTPEEGRRDEHIEGS